MSRETLELIFATDALTPDLVWQQIQVLIGSSMEARFNISGETAIGTMVATTIARRPKPHFEISGSGFSFGFCPLPNFNHTLLEIRTAESKPLDEWRLWVEQFAHHSLISGRIYDVEYEHWQNAEDPLEYTSQGRSYCKLPLRSNGLPFPLEKRVIDISTNPGRRVLRHGYVEAIGTTMWLTPQFAKITRANFAELKSLAWCNTIEFGDGIRIHVMDKCFTSAEGIQGDIQNMLRTILFPAR